jgi:hypothetical protein
VGSAQPSVGVTAPVVGSAPALIVADVLGAAWVVLGSPSAIAAAGLRRESDRLDSSEGAANAAEAHVPMRTITTATTAAAARRRQ